ncbi:MAG: response regulator transcription factor, partial [Bacteroidota bacterium]
MSLRIAIIEDEKNIVKNLKHFIELKTDFQVAFTCESVPMFFDELRSKKNPDIILLDIGLPHISGLDALPKIKSKLPDVDVIMLTTYDETETIFKALCL